MAIFLFIFQKQALRLNFMYNYCEEKTRTNGFHFGKNKIKRRVLLKSICCTYSEGLVYLFC